MDAVLVVNAFLNSKKFTDLHNHLVESASGLGIDLKVKTNMELSTTTPKCDFVLFWDKDINLAKRLEISNIPVFNSSKSIELCDDKAKTYLELLNVVNQPKTFIAPLVFSKSDLTDFVVNVEKEIKYPLVFKECFGSFGQQVYLCRNREEVLSHISDKPFILQEFIESSKGFDIRLEVVGDKVVSAVKRTNPNDFRSNVTNGGYMEEYIPKEEEKETALMACKKLGLTFGGVDILEGNILCEVNSNAHIINIMNTNGIDIAPLIFGEIISKL